MNGIFNTNIRWPDFLYGCLPVVGPVNSEYLILNPRGGPRNIDADGRLYRAVIDGQIFSSHST